MMSSFLPSLQTQLLNSNSFILSAQLFKILPLPTQSIVQSSPRRLYVKFRALLAVSKMPLKAVTAFATTAESARTRHAGESKGFMEEVRFVAMKLHTKEQAKEGEKRAGQTEEQSLDKWEPTTEGYLRFLVDSKLVHDTLEKIVDNASFPACIYELILNDSEFRYTGLERSASLAKDLEWFREQGHTIPEPSSPGLTYAQYLIEVSAKDPQAFICHFYTIYFDQSAGGRMIGKKVAEKILNNKVLEFYKWEGQISQLLQNVRDKLNKVAEGWTREEKNHCLEEIEKSFKLSRAVQGLVFSIMIISECSAICVII